MRKTSYMVDGSVYVATFINILLIRTSVGGMERHRMRETELGRRETFLVWAKKVIKVFLVE